MAKGKIAKKSSAKTAAKPKPTGKATGSPVQTQAKTASAPIPAAVTAQTGLRRVVKVLATPLRGETKFIEVDGPLALLGATVVMQSAGAGISQIGLEIDGELLHVVRSDHLVARGMIMPNASGVFATHSSYGNTWTVIFGWPHPVDIQRSLRVLVAIGEDMAELELSAIVQSI